MKTTAECGAAVVLLVLLTACSSSGPTSPTGTTPLSGTTPPAALPPPQLTFPPLSGPSRTFIFDRDVSYPVREYTRNSRVVLYENGAFGLRYPSIGEAGYEYRGQYQNANGAIMFLFEFQGRSVGSAFNDATGTLKGDSLTVQYDWNMRMADFEDAVYVLRP